MNSVAIILPTYKRRLDLIRCVQSIALSASRSCLDVSVDIYNNDPDDPLDKAQLGHSFGSIKISITNRPENTGPRGNIYMSLRDTYSKNPRDVYVFLSDDDFVLPDFFSRLESAFLNGSDAAIFSCVVLAEQEMHKPGFVIARSHTYRFVPTRPYASKRLQFITDSRLLSGSAYSHGLLERFFDYISLSQQNESFFCSLWYQMAFLASFSVSPSFIEDPCLCHAQGNTTHWGDIENYREFFLGRIDMFSEMYNAHNINAAERDALVVDFISHQNPSRVLRVLASRKLPVLICSRIAIKAMAVNFIFRVSSLASALARRLPSMAKFLLKI